jgi:hypothetical protein
MFFSILSTLRQRKLRLNDERKLATGNMKIGKATLPCIIDLLFCSRVYKLPDKKYMVKEEGHAAVEAENHRFFPQGNLYGLI